MLPKEGLFSQRAPSLQEVILNHRIIHSRDIQCFNKIAGDNSHHPVHHAVGILNACLGPIYFEPLIRL